MAVCVGGTKGSEEQVGAPRLWAVSEFCRWVGRPGSGGATGCVMPTPHPESLGMMGFTPLLGSPVPPSARERDDALGPEDDHASESALSAVLEGARALEVWPCDPASQDQTWGWRLPITARVREHSL